MCHLEIVLKRAADPGQIITSGNDGGDLDNRLKLIFDALRIPLAPNEVPAPLWGNPDDFKNGVSYIALLEDDSLISKITIEARRLNTLKASSAGSDYAEIDINATLKMLRPNRFTHPYVG